MKLLKVPENHHIIVENDRIFIVRNVYTTNNYQKFGTLVLELNKKICLQI